MSAPTVLAILFVPSLVVIATVVALSTRRWRAVCTCGHTTWPCHAKQDAASEWVAHRRFTLRSQCSRATVVRSWTSDGARHRATRVAAKVGAR